MFTGEAYSEYMHEILPLSEELVGGDDYYSDDEDNEDGQGPTPVLNLKVNQTRCSSLFSSRQMRRFIIEQ